MEPEAWAEPEALAEPEASVEPEASEEPEAWEVHKLIVGVAAYLVEKPVVEALAVLEMWVEPLQQEELVQLWNHMKEDHP